MIRKREQEKTDLGRTANLKQIINCPLFHYLLKGTRDTGFSEELRLDVYVTKFPPPINAKALVRVSSIFFLIAPSSWLYSVFP